METSELEIRTLSLPHKFFLVGLGAAALTLDTASRFARGMVGRGQQVMAELPKPKKPLRQKVKTARCKDAANSLENKVRHAVEKAGLAGRDGLDEINQQISRIESQLAELEKTKDQTNIE